MMFQLHMSFLLWPNRRISDTANGVGEYSHPEGYAVALFHQLQAVHHLSLMSHQYFQQSKFSRGSSKLFTYLQYLLT